MDEAIPDSEIPEDLTEEQLDNLQERAETMLRAAALLANITEASQKEGKAEMAMTMGAGAQACAVVAKSYGRVLDHYGREPSPETFGVGSTASELPEEAGGRTAFH